MCVCVCVCVCARIRMFVYSTSEYPAEAEAFAQSAALSSSLAGRQGEVKEISWKEKFLESVRRQDMVWLR